MFLRPTRLSKSNKFEKDYRVRIGWYETTTDEPGYEYFVDPKCDYVHFFDLKSSFYWILKDTKYALAFLDDIEKIFLEGKKVKKEDIDRLLENIKKRFNGEALKLTIGNNDG